MNTNKFYMDFLTVPIFVSMAAGVIILSLSFLLINQPHPLIFGVGLVICSVFLSFLLWQTTHSPTNSIFIVMVYTGGLLILFIYLCAMSPSPMLKINDNKSPLKNFLSLTKILMVGGWCMDTYIKQNNNNSSFFKEKIPMEWCQNIFYSTPHLFWLCFLLTYIYFWGFIMSKSAPTPMWNSF